jgi:hypothetical protein
LVGVGVVWEVVVVVRGVGGGGGGGGVWWRWRRCVEAEEEPLVVNHESQQSGVHRPDLDANGWRNPDYMVIFCVAALLFIAVALLHDVLYCLSVYR